MVSRGGMWRRAWIIVERHRSCADPESALRASGQCRAERSRGHFRIVVRHLKNESQSNVIPKKRSIRTRSVIHRRVPQSPPIVPRTPKHALAPFILHTNLYSPLRSMSSVVSSLPLCPKYEGGAADVFLDCPTGHGSSKTDGLKEFMKQREGGGVAQRNGHVPNLR